MKHRRLVSVLLAAAILFAFASQAAAAVPSAVDSTAFSHFSKMTAVDLRGSDVAPLRLNPNKSSILPNLALYHKAVVQGSEMTLNCYYSCYCSGNGDAAYGLFVFKGTLDNLPDTTDKLVYQEVYNAPNSDFEETYNWNTSGEATGDYTVFFFLADQATSMVYYVSLPVHVLAQAKHMTGIGFMDPNDESTLSETIQLNSSNGEAQYVVPQFTPADTTDARKYEIAADSSCVNLETACGITEITGAYCGTAVVTITCGKFSSSLTVKVNGGEHTFSEDGTYYQAPTATRPGKSVGTCTTCKQQVEEEIPPVFRDVNANAYYAEALEYCYENGLMYGTSKTTFSPNANMTRAQLATILYRASKAEDDTSIQLPFTDIKMSEYYVPALRWAYANKIIYGTSETTFSPNDTITREQAMAYFYRYYQHLGYTPANEGDLSAAFKDYNTISEYARPAIAWAYGNQLIFGVSSDRIGPKETLTRAQGTAFLYRFLVRILPPAEEPQPENP